MAEWKAINIATITEEKVEGEEVGEDGTVETIISPTQKQRPKAESRSSSLADEDDDNQRPSSLVEKEVEEGEDSRKVINSILSSLTRNSDPPNMTPSVTLPRTTLPRTHPAAPRSSAPRSKTLPRAGSRASGFTMNLSEKFVTELSFYDPDGNGEPLQSPIILLGVFLATDQILGDHSVYKVSPVSPLGALKIRPQDRLLKINGISLEGWSHGCVVDYMKSLTLAAAATATQNDADTPTDLMLSMELRRVGRSVRSSQEAPPSRILDATLRIRKRRATVTAVQERDTCVRFRTTLPHHLKAAKKGLHLCTSVSPCGVAGLVVQAEDQEGAGRFLLHTFDASSSTSASSSPHIGGRGGGGRGGGGCGGGGGGGGVAQGEVVMVVECAAHRSWFLHASSPTSVSLMYAAALEPQTLTEKDVRFFSLLPVPGDHLFRIQNLATGSFLSVTPDCLGLVTREVDGTLPDSTLLRVLPC